MIELLITLLIASMLLTLSMAGYGRFIERGQRQSAQSVLVELVAQIQQLKANRPNGVLTETLDPKHLITQPLEGYRLSVLPNPIGAATEFFVVAEPAASGRQAGKGALTLTHIGQGCWHKNQDRVTSAVCDAASTVW